MNMSVEFNKSVASNTMPPAKRTQWERTLSEGCRSAERGNPFWTVADAKASRFMLGMWGRA